MTGFKFYSDLGTDRFLNWRNTKLKRENLEDFLIIFVSCPWCLFNERLVYDWGGSVTFFCGNYPQKKLTKKQREMSFFSKQCHYKATVKKSELSKEEEEHIELAKRSINLANMQKECRDCGRLCGSLFRCPDCEKKFNEGKKPISDTGIQVCSHCRGAMRTFINKKTGKPFQGCSNWKYCRK